MFCGQGGQEDGPKIPLRALGSQGLKVGALGYGAMGLTAFYGSPQKDETSINIIKKCVELGITMIDTAEIYQNKLEDGTLIYNETVVGKAVKEIGRDKVTIATKHINWMDTPKDKVMDCVRNAVEGSLKRLGVECIDLYYLHRMYKKPVEIEDVMECFKVMKEEGKIKYIGLSEAAPELIRRAHKVLPITAVQQEWSLIARDLEEHGIVSTCRELGIGLVPYSPLARGFLAGQHQDKTPEDWRKNIPYMQDEHRENNSEVIKTVTAIAEEKKLTIAQLSLAWVCNQGVDVFPIPGTTKIARITENSDAAIVKLTAEEIKTIGDAAAKIRGARGDESYMQMSFQASMKKEEQDELNKDEEKAEA